MVEGKSEDTNTPAETEETTEAPSDTEAAGEKKKVVYIAGGLNNPSAKLIVEALEEEVARLGNIELQVMDGESSAEKQLPLLENCLTLKPAAVAISAQDPKGQLAALKKLVEADIPVLSCESTMDASADFDYYGVGGDLELQGKILGEYFAETLPEGAEYAMISGIQGNMAQILRDKGFRDGIASNPTLKEVFYQDCGFDRAKAVSAMQDCLQAHPNVAGVFSIDTPMALGALQALKDAGKNGEVLLVGIDLNDEGILSLKDGDMSAIVKMDLQEEGRRIGQMLSDMAWGQEPEWTDQIDTCKYYTIQPILVTKDNLAEEVPES